MKINHPYASQCKHAPGNRGLIFSNMVTKPIYYKKADRIQYAAFNPEFNSWTVLDLNYFQIRTVKDWDTQRGFWELIPQDEFKERLEFFLKVHYLKSLGYPNSQWNSTEKVSTLKLTI